MILIVLSGCYVIVCYNNDIRYNIYVGILYLKLINVEKVLY